jgi:hypothetical protein
MLLNMIFSDLLMIPPEVPQYPATQLFTSRSTRENQCKTVPPPTGIMFSSGVEDSENVGKTALFITDHIGEAPNNAPFRVAIRTARRAINGGRWEYSIQASAAYCDEETEEPAAMLFVPDDEEEYFAQHFVSWYAPAADLEKTKSWKMVVETLRNFITCYFDETGEKRPQAEAEQLMTSERPNLLEVSVTDEGNHL